MGIFENKYIPLLDSVTYEIELKPKKVDPSGRIRTPEEIKNGTKVFLHTVCIDKIGNVYILPAKNINGECVEYFTHEHIIKAAMGDMQSKLLIESARNEIKTIFNKDLLSDKYIHDCYKPLNKCNKNDQESIEKLLITLSIDSILLVLLLTIFKILALLFNKSLFSII